mmetsp:Transcript_23273/g.46335  ORF Transcript_23273/g.46335 Transcript_23273/m.46335 type:complete len:178 (+) Transcript_23273:1-534(+)
MGCLFSSEPDDAPSAAQLVTFDPARHGPEVVVGNFNVTGKGSALANCALHQDAAFFEVKVVQPGVFAVGVARKLKPEDLAGPIGDGNASYALRSDAEGLTIAENDVIGVAYGQCGYPMLRFFHNGVELEAHGVDKTKGLLYPAVYVENCQLDATFSSGFSHAPPSGFSGVIMARDTL